MKQPHFEHVCEHLDRVRARLAFRARLTFRAAAVEGIVPMGRTRKVG